jgi:hypothetical protein
MVRKRLTGRPGRVALDQGMRGIVHGRVVPDRQAKLERDTRKELPDTEPLRACCAETCGLGCCQSCEVNGDGRIRLTSEVVGATSDFPITNRFTRQSTVQSVANCDDVNL